MKYSDVIPPLEDFPFGSEGYLGGLVTPEQLRGLLFSAGAGGAGIFVATQIANRIPVDALRGPRAKAGVMIALGLIGGRLLWDMNEDAAKGVAGAVAGYGAASLVASFLPSSMAISLGADEWTPDGVSALGATTVSSENRAIPLLAGASFGLGDAVVSEREMLGSWIS